MRKVWLSGCMLVLTAMLAACNDSNVGMGNPASIHCDEQGGTLEIRTDAAGGEYGVCKFDDGTECEEWAYYRDECKPGDFEMAPAPSVEE